MQLTLVSIFSRPNSQKKTTAIITTHPDKNLSDAFQQLIRAIQKWLQQPWHATLMAPL